MDVWVITGIEPWALDSSVYTEDNRLSIVGETRLCVVGATEEAVRNNFFPRLGSPPHDPVTTLFDKKVFYNFDGEEGSLVAVEWYGRTEYYLVRRQPFIEEIPAVP